MREGIKAQEKANLRNHPVVKAILTKFPGAEIVSVTPPEKLIAAPQPETPAGDDIEAEALYEPDYTDEDL